MIKILVLVLVLSGCASSIEKSLSIEIDCKKCSSIYARGEEMKVKIKRDVSVKK